MSRRRGSLAKWLKWAIIVLAGLVILPLVVLALALLVLQTGLGERIARQQIVARANQSLSGALEVGALDVDGAEFHLKDVVLRDPEGEPVATIAAVDVRLGVGALFHKTLQIERVRIARPEVHLVQSGEGTNLQRALEPREPKPPKTEEKGKKLRVDVRLDALTIEKGILTYQSTNGGKEVAVSVTDLDLDAALSLLDGGDVLDGTVNANGALESPQQGPLKLHASARGEGSQRTVDVEFSASGAELRGNATMEGDRAEHLDAHLQRLVLPPALVRAFVPTYPIIATVQGSATATRRGDAIQGAAHLSAGSGWIDARGDFDLQTFRSSGITVQVRNVDLSELVAEGPKSDLRLSIQAQGGGRSAETAEGSLRVEAPPSTIDGSTFGPIRLEADAKDGRLSLHRFDARVPGLALAASGEASRDWLALHGHIQAKDLALLGDTLGRLTGPEGIPIEGSGQLTFAITGPAHSPGVSASGTFPLLKYAQNSVRDLRLRL
ncbi:MAG TPA: AsmA family protein, partial [Myxococcaceae bacterium]|nr:AsmA family protein [Myxococcaceae bacterium]